MLSAFADEAAADIVGQVQALQRNNIKYIEIRNVDGKSIIDQETSRINEIAQGLKESSIGVSAIGSPIGKIGVFEPFEPHVEAFKRTLEAAHLLGTKRIRLFSFFLPKDKTAGACRDEVLERLDKLLCLAEAEEIFCCHENEKGIYGGVQSTCLDLHRTFGKRLSEIFDPANFIQCGEEPEKIFDDLFPYIDYMHIKDALLTDGAVVPAGCGDAGMEKLLHKFSAAEGSRFLTVEPHLTVFYGFQNLKDDTHKTKYVYTSQAEAFDTAVGALKEILEKGGYDYE